MNPLVPDHDSHSSELSLISGPILSSAIPATLVPDPVTSTEHHPNKDELSLMATTPAHVVSGSRPLPETSIATVITTTNTTTSTTSSLSTATADVPTSVQNIIDNSPREGQDIKTKNAKLAREDDNDDNHIEGDHGSNEKKQNSNSSLATGAGKLVGLALAIPNAQISVPEGDQGHNQNAPDHPQTKAYLEEADKNVTKGAGLTREQSNATSPAHVDNTTLPSDNDNRNESASPTPSPTIANTTTGAATAGNADTSSTSSSSSPSISSSSSSSSTSTEPASRPCDIGASKDMLTEGQAFAYVGLCLVTANKLFQALEGTETAHAKESLESFVSKLINRLYRHLDIDANTQRTIAQLPQMQIQPEDLLESFVADGTQRVVSSQQVDQMASSGASSPVLSRHSRQYSNASVSSLISLNSVQQRYQNKQTVNSDDGNGSSSQSPFATPSLSSVPRASISSLRSDFSSGNVSLETSTTEPVNRTSFQQSDSACASTSSTLVNESPVSTRVSISSQKAITVDLRWTLIADLFLISISDSVYDSRARVLLKTVGCHLGMEWDEIVLFEKGIMKQLQQTTIGDGLLKPDTKSRNDESRKRRMIMMGLATVGGGLVLGLSAGLFAPVIGAGIGAALAGAHITGATATAASAFLAGSGGIAVITSGAAVTGSGIAMKKMARRTAGIDTFEFLSIHDNGRVNVILTISGWLDIGDEDASLPFSTLDPINGDHFALFWEPEMLMQLGNALGLLATEVITLTAQEILKHTLLSALLSALAWPMALTRLGYLIDNPWSIALDRAKLAGLVLADSLLMRSYLGFRPVTLVGYSLGARVIFYCLMELGRLDAFGIVEDAYLFGAPVTASEAQWRQARSAVAGDFVSGHLRNDWVLGFLFRATTGGLGTVAGLRPIKNVPGLTNMDLTSYVEGHLDYRVKVPLLMKLMGLKITSESFLDKEEAILHQRSLKIKPNETLKAPKPMMPSKDELAKSGTLTENEKMQLEVAFRRPAPMAKIPDLDSIKGLSPEEMETLREALESAAAAQAGGSPSPVELRSKR
ncbi:hypothetical protein BG011_002880 [Mortierella polycephala]|uniref:DUF726-domain-containing protein n=1 Tax=Mortierella polycephala TaxID=41804 RepID=A0A9P6Q248_9FUNG|nr:hypothetical protein BG011_002880 [Mortierella polycephala]